MTSRKRQQISADANNISSKTGPQDPDGEELLEGINVRGQTHNIDQGQKACYDSERTCTDRRGSSPEQNNCPGEQSPQRHNNSQLSTRLPLMNCTSRGKLAQTQQVHGSKVQAPSGQSGTKRKREDDAGAADDESPQYNKKAHTGLGEMAPTISQKAVTGMAAILKLSEEERQKLRAARFSLNRSTQHKAPVTPKVIPKDTLPHAAKKLTKKRKQDGVGETGSNRYKKTQRTVAQTSAVDVQFNTEEQCAELRELMKSHQAEKVDYPPDTAIRYVDYSIYSIPVLYSVFIEHEYPFEPIDKPSESVKRTMSESEIELFGRKMLLIRQAALRLTKNKNNRLPEVYRRNGGPKTGPTKVIEDCDLYLHDGKIHVATEFGLLTVPDYLKLIDVPETQRYRFEGRRPSWMKKVLERKVLRRAAVTFEPSNILEAEGCIMFPSDTLLTVLDQGVFDINLASGEESRMAYGLRDYDGVEGWFPYEATCRRDWLQDPGEETKPDPNIIDWTKFDYASEGSNSVSASPQSCKLQAEDIPILTTTVFSLSRRDSSQFVSQPTVFGGSAGNAKDINASHESATVIHDDSSTSNPSTVLETIIDTFTKPHNSPLVFSGTANPLWKDEDDVDYDDDEL
ncbi:hypothetical protein GMOD_00001801 [Pyrenophora seminiperda CCB06]|uniref:Uncharacterized protein n=1 Tax=Pyrenophora seminiperda CCB06 TaxID=1302712 RepID=A0A3M7LW51_9PLEO|nr:hypothetical protein GMOD_00001801 [Pyrenophora seminiperda CCB06]